MNGDEVIAWRVFRTGAQSLVRDVAGRYYVTLRNRTNDTRVQIPEEKVGAWRRALTPTGHLEDAAKP